MAHVGAELSLPGERALEALQQRVEVRHRRASARGATRRAAGDRTGARLPSCRADGSARRWAQAAAHRESGSGGGQGEGEQPGSQQQSDQRRERAIDLSRAPRDPHSHVAAGGRHRVLGVGPGRQHRLERLPRAARRAASRRRATDRGRRATATSPARLRRPSTPRSTPNARTPRSFPLRTPTADRRAALRPSFANARASAASRASNWPQSA